MRQFPARFKIADIKKDSDRCLKSSGSDPFKFGRMGCGLSGAEEKAQKAENS